MVASKRKALLRKMALGMLFFGRHVMPHTFELESPPFHSEIARACMDLLQKRTVIRAPRGSAKSTIVAGVLVLWHIFLEDLYRYLTGLDEEYTPRNKLIVIGSETQDLAKRLLHKIKNVLEYNERFRTLFGYYGEQSNHTRVWTKEEVAFHYESVTVTIVCKGMQQPLRGIKDGDQRITLFIGDDLEGERNTKTSEAMEGNYRWLMGAVDHALDRQRGRAVIVGTPLHQRCLVEELSKEESGWKALHFSAIEGLGTPDEKSLWEVMWPLEELKGEMQRMEKLGRVSIFYQEMMCVITGDLAALFLEEYMQYWKGACFHTGGEHFLEITEIKGDILEEPEYRPVTVFSGVDPASSTSDYADRSACVTIAVDVNWNIFILPYYADRERPKMVAHRIVREYDRYRPLKLRIEDIGFQEMLRDEIKEKRPDIPVASGKPRRQKKVGAGSRLESMQPFFANLQVFLPAGEADLLRDELLLYPRASHDDIMDALYYAMKGRYRPFHEWRGQKPGHQLAGDRPAITHIEKDEYEDWMVV